MRFSLQILGTLLLLVIGTSFSHAVTTFNNFGPEFGRDQTAGVLVSGSEGEFGERVAGLQFTAGASGTFYRLWIAVSAKNNGRPNDGLRLTLTTDDANLPGEALESLVLNDVCYVDFECPSGQLYSLTASGTTELIQGTTYWLLGTSDLASADFTWYLTSEIAPALVYLENGFIGTLPFNSPPALRIDVAEEPGGGGEIPEPTSLLLLTLLAGIALTLRASAR